METCIFTPSEGVKAGVAAYVHVCESCLEKLDISKYYRARKERK